MVSTGIEPVADVQLKFHELQKDHKLAWVVLQLSKKSEKSRNFDQISVDCVGETGSTFAELVEKLPKGTARFVIYDCKYQGKDGQEKAKVALINWCDENATTKEKLMSASGLDTLKKKFGSALHCYFDIHEHDELTEKNIMEIVKDKCR